MSNFAEDSDSDVDRDRMNRPPSSYGSMHSDDQDEDYFEDVASPPTRVRLQRPDSPETAITERTQTHQSSIHHSGGVYLTRQSITQEEFRSPAPPTREPTILDQSELQSEIRTEAEMDEEPNDREMDFQDQQNEGSAMEVQEEQAEAATVEDFDEIVEYSVEQRDPPPRPPEGAGLHFQHTHTAFTLRHVLMAMVRSLSQLHPSDMGYYKRSLSTHCRFKKNYATIKDLQDPLDVADKMIEICGQGEALYLTVRNLQSIGRDDLAVILRKTCRRVLLQHDLKIAHDRRYYSLYEGRCRPGQQRYISDVYVEPVTVIRGRRDVVNPENEVRKIPYTIEETAIRPADIFCPLPQDQKPVRTVIMTGVPACGLTVAISKFIIDWMEEKTNRDFQFIFPLPAKDLNFGKDKDRSFLEVISYFYGEAENIKFLEKEDCLCLFIIDSLEMCQHPLDFKNNKTITSAREPAKFDVLLTNLIKGTLLPHCKVWITSHVTDTYRIPSNLVDRYVELRGWTDDKKEEFFTKRTPEPELGRKVYNHMKRSKALEIICHLPLFSWMVAYIYERAFRDPEFGKHPPGITAFYSQYIVVQMNRSFEKYRGCNVDAQKWTDFDKNFTELMGKMAYRMIQEARDYFTVDDLQAVGLKYDDLKCRDGLTTEVKRESADVRTWVFKFVHVTVQEYIAAMYVYVAYRKNGKNVIEPNKMTSWLPGSNKDRSVIDLYRPAIDRALASPNGQWDMFLRFLIGLVTPGTEENLHGYQLNHYHPKAKGTEDVVKYIKKKMKDSLNPDRYRNLELCLVELEEGKEEVRR